MKLLSGLIFKYVDKSNRLHSFQWEYLDWDNNPIHLRDAIIRAGYRIVSIDLSKTLLYKMVEK